MGNLNRAGLLTKAHKVLKQHYKPVEIASRPLLEQLLYACCLDSVAHSTADKVYAKLVETFFDWNEVRVTSVDELAEVLQPLPDPAAVANNLKRILQSTFEGSYSYDLELIKKEKISRGMELVKEIDGVTPFVLAFVTQNGLGGHAIPLDKSTAEVLFVVGILTLAEAQNPGSVAAIERAIPKNKGQEFGSLIHQLGADFAASPYSTNVRNIILAIAPEAKDRLPKRPAPKKEDSGTAEETAGSAKSARKPVAPVPAPVKGKKPAAPAPKVEAKPEKGSKPKDSKQKESVKKEVAPPKKKAPSKPPVVEKKEAAKQVPAKQLTKRKPR